MIPEYSTVDLFCGAGGMSYGLTKAGFTPVFALDIDLHATATYRRNIGNHVVTAGVAEVSPDEVIRRTGIQAGEFFLVCGGPPCQGFSIQRRGSSKDERNKLVNAFIDFALGLRPKFIMMENVPTLLGTRGKAVIDRATKSLMQGEYTVSAAILNAVDFGVPQQRKRAILVAKRHDVKGFYEFPLAVLSKEEWITVKKAIGDLPAPYLRASDSNKYPNHILVNISKMNELRISHVPEGGGRLDLPEHLQLPCHRNDNGHRHLDVFGRMRWDGPAPTITGRFDNFTRGRFAHPKENRVITSREGARLQSFPDHYVFCGPKKDVALQIGNAVPPKLAYHLGLSLKNCAGI